MALLGDWQHMKRTILDRGRVGLIQFGLAYVIYTRTKRVCRQPMFSLGYPFPFALLNTKQFDIHSFHPRETSTKENCRLPQPVLSGARRRQRARRHGSGASGEWYHRQGNGGGSSNRQQKRQSRRRHLIVLTACSNLVWARTKTAPIAVDNLPRGISSGGILRSRRSLCVMV